MRNTGIYVLSIILITVGCYAGVLPAEAQAQNSEESNLTYELLTLHIMPHYVEPEEWNHDEPAVLTGVHGTLINESETVFMGDIEIPVPSDWPAFQFASAGEVADGEVVSELEAAVDEEAGVVTLQPENGIGPGENYHIVLEYYSAISSTDSPFEFNYVYELERSAHTMNILFFEPYGSENFELSVEADFETEMFDIPVHAYSMGALEPGQVLDVMFTYEKEEQMTTVEALASGESAEYTAVPEELANPSQSTNHVETVFMIVISTVITGLFIFFILHGRRKKRNKLTSQGGGLP